jgi:ATP-dependent DNA helicase RecG
VQPFPARRLIQGEVGSGKTVVAAFALYCAALNRTRSILVAPTQILAQQHFHTLSQIFSKLQIPLILVTQAHAMPPTFEDNTIFIGTHALFSHKKTIQPAVVVVDEEHRFGVKQRETFWPTGETTKKPHLITMTATPIPRTIAHTILANQDVSYLEEIPEKKKKITTKVVNKENRKKAYVWIDQHIEKGAQVFAVCPFIDQSEQETLANVKSATKTFAEIKKVFSKRRVALMHGKVKQEERAEILKKMRDGKVDILVATSMIEVGIDLPRASIIVIEGSERFGLAQLHQLRGRVGRAGQQAYCFLFTTEGIETTKRLQKLEKETDGNILAEYDLKLRGTGELLGTRQHGFDALKFASWFDEGLIEECREVIQFK